MKLIKELDRLFGPEDGATIPVFYIKQMLRQGWSGSLCSDRLRAFCWRVLLGLISSTDKSLWKDQLQSIFKNYNELKQTAMPSLDKVEVDPLTALDTPHEESEWKLYYRNMEVMSIIKTDLDRLYLTGIDDDFFHTEERRSILLAILTIWSEQHPVISYRQGMHEVAGYILYCVEVESDAWEEAMKEEQFKHQHSLYEAFNKDTIEAHTYSLFSRIMNELEALYDPASTKLRGFDNQPFVVQYCTKIQEHYLRMLDPVLCTHLEDCFVQAQLYGLRWSRLLLGREFTAANSQIYRIWDYIFVSCHEVEYFSADDYFMDTDAPPNIYSVLASVRISGYKQNSNTERRRLALEKFIAAEHEDFSPTTFASTLPQYVCTPLLGTLADFMLAMLLHVRETLINADATAVMAILMHYPEQESVMPIIDYCDMIRRGVIVKEANLGGSEGVTSNAAKTLAASYALSIRAQANTGQSSSRSFLRPLTPSRSSMINDSSGGSWLNPNSLKGMGSKMTTKLSAVGAIMGNGLNDIVNSFTDSFGEGGPQNSSGEGHQKINYNAASTAARIDSGSSSSNSIKATSKLERSASIKRDPFGMFEPMSNVETEIQYSHQQPQQTQSQRLEDATNSLPMGGKRIPSTDLVTSESKSSEELVTPMPTRRRTDGSFSLTADGFKDHYPTSSRNLMNTSSKWMPLGNTARPIRRSSEGIILPVVSAQNLLKEARKKDVPAEVEIMREAGNRLLDIADLLSDPPYLSYPVAVVEGREAHFECELRKGTVAKLRALADLLGGIGRISDYDMIFGSSANSTRNKVCDSSEKSSSNNSVVDTGGIDGIDAAVDEIPPASEEDVANNSSNDRPCDVLKTPESVGGEVNVITPVTAATTLATKSRAQRDGREIKYEVFDDPPMTQSKTNASVARSTLSPTQKLFNDVDEDCNTSTNVARTSDDDKQLMKTETSEPLRVLLSTPSKSMDGILDTLLERRTPSFPRSSIQSNNSDLSSKSEDLVSFSSIPAPAEMLRVSGAAEVSSTNKEIQSNFICNEKANKIPTPLALIGGDVGSSPQSAEGAASSSPPPAEEVASSPVSAAGDARSTPPLFTEEAISPPVSVGGEVASSSQAKSVEAAASGELCALDSDKEVDAVYSSPTSFVTPIRADRGIFSRRTGDSWWEADDEDD